MNYFVRGSVNPNKLHLKLVLPLLIALLLLGGYLIYTQLSRPQTVAESIAHYLEYDASVTPEEKLMIEKAMADQAIKLIAPVTAKIKTSDNAGSDAFVTNTYVPITGFNNARQDIAASALLKLGIYLPADLSDSEKTAIGQSLELEDATIMQLTSSSLDADNKNIAFIPVKDLNSRIKLLSFNGKYYLDSFTSGGLFREVVFEGLGAEELSVLKHSGNLNSANVFTVNMTGVTALTREMMRKLSSVGDPKYFSQKIGDFLADADLTHVSNEVSFKESCSYSRTSFCSPPEFIETLKDSGVDLVELTGNHNNDAGSEYYTATIKQYRELGWNTVGGGLNTTDAAKPFISNQKNSKVGFLAYNFADSPGSGALAGPERAGANGFDYDKIASDIKSVRSKADFIIVNVQFWECYSYPEEGYVEYPVCDKPIGQQESVFKKLIDLGADMVVGSSAHQPQTYELYDEKPIYYGLGNLYFEQTQWPGTERGIVLTHYFSGGKLLQTKLTPTVYDKSLQTRLMSSKEADYLLTRLAEAR